MGSRSLPRAKLPTHTFAPVTQEWVRIIDPPAGFGATSYAYAVAKGDPKWLAEVDAFVVAARADGTLAKAAEKNGLTPILVR